MVNPRRIKDAINQDDRGRANAGNRACYVEASGRNIKEGLDTSEPVGSTDSCRTRPDQQGFQARKQRVPSC
eukprot:354575-Chlamydomonas_euryale.AAC.8